jgi:hypothetical protein
MCFKQWAVREFLVAGKESGIKIHKQLKNGYMVSTLLIKELFSNGLP